MDAPRLNAVTRTAVQKATKWLRHGGKIPAVVYGPGVSSRAIEVDGVSFRKVYRAAGESSLVELVIDEKEPVKVLIHDLQSDPLKDTVRHVDFLQVNMAERLRAEILLAFVGEAPAVKGLGGTLVKNRDAVEVECLPGDLVAHITVDIAPLATFDDLIRVKDLVVPPRVVVLTDPEEVVALVEAPRSEEELKALEGAVETSVEAVDVVEKKKKAEEGEEAAPPAEKEKE